MSFLYNCLVIISPVTGTNERKGEINQRDTLGLFFRNEVAGKRD